MICTQVNQNIAGELPSSRVGSAWKMKTIAPPMIFGANAVCAKRNGGWRRELNERRLIDSKQESK
jgi:hypothetical protein